MFEKSSKQIFEKEKEVLFQTYNRYPIAVDYAEGCYIYDFDGNKYLDLLGGIAVNTLGHSHPKIISAIKEQAEKYLHLSNYFYQLPQIELAELLVKITGYNRVFFSNSGTEAVEGAIKLARRWGNQQGKEKMFGFTGGFHGRTYGALSLMDKPLYKDKMGPYLDKMYVLPYNDIDALKQNIDESTTAVILEFIQGEGGISTAQKDFVQTIFELKEKYNFLVIADEIQAGVGRTGKFFAFEHYAVKPDIVTLAKGLGGGLPLGAILGTEALANVWERGMHGTTFGGNALACTTGLITMQEVINGLMKNAEIVGNYLKEQLTALKETFADKITEIRGFGLMQGIVFNFEAKKIVEELIKEGVITNYCSVNVLRLVPPLIINKKEIDVFIEAIKKVLLRQ